MKKKLLHTILAGVFAVAALMMNVSCSDITAGFTPEGNKVYLQPSIGEINRTVFPDITTEKLNTLKLEFDCGTQHGTIAIYDNYKALAGQVIALDPDTYKFTLTAECGGVKLTGTIPAAKYEASSQALALNFDLSYDLKEAVKEGCGNVSYKFVYSKDKAIKEASVNFFKCDDNGNPIDWNGVETRYPMSSEYYTEAKSMTDGTHYIDYSFDNILCGLYEMRFEIKAEDETFASYNNYVYVAKDCDSVEKYEIKDTDWYNKYNVASAAYTASAPHFSAEATENGILITVKYDTEHNLDVYDILEEDSKININLYSWYNDDFYPANKVPVAGQDVQVLYPFTKAGKKYIFKLTRQQYDNTDTQDVNESFWDDSEKIIVTATHDGINVFDDDYHNKLSRMAIEVSPSSYETTLKYDWRKLFAKVDTTVFEKFDCTGQIFAGDKSWAEGRTTNGNGETGYHKFVGEYYSSYDHLTLDLLSDEGKSQYLNFLNGITLIDPLEISNIREYGSYWANTGLEFQLKNNPVLFKVSDVESEVVADPNEERITITYVSPENWVNSNNIMYVSKSYKKGITIELQNSRLNNEYSFADWYKNADYSGEPVKEYDCSEDITLYAKYNFLANNWGYVNDGKEQEKNNYYANIRLSEAQGFNGTITKDAPFIVTLKGKVVSDYTGKLSANVFYLDENFNLTFLTWCEKSKETFTAGSNFEWEMPFVAYQADINETYSDSEADFVPCNFLSIHADNDNNNTLFELSDYSISIDQAPVKVTLKNSVSSNIIASEYYHKDTAVTLPSGIEECALILNSWYDNENCTGDPVTQITAVEEKTYYATMDVKLSDETWINPTSGLIDGHYAAGFYLDYLKCLDVINDNVTLEGFTDGYKLKQGDKVKIEFTGKSKESYRDEFYIQVFDPRESGWLESCEYRCFKEDGAETWDDSEKRTVAEGGIINHTVEVEITQVEFESANPFIAFGYNYTPENNKENSYSDWEIKLTLTKSE